MRSRRQISREVFTGERFMSLIDCSDNETEEETEYFAASTSEAVSSWLNGPAQDTRKLNLSYGDSMQF